MKALPPAEIKQQFIGKKNYKEIDYALIKKLVDGVIERN